MKLHHLNFNLIPSLYALLNQKSIADAARVMHVSPSAMSKTLGQLRDHFHDPLIIREGSRTRLSEKALAIRLSLQAAITEATTAFTGKSFDPASSTEHFRIAADSLLHSRILATVLGRLKRQAPHMSFSLLNFGSDGESRLRAGDIDIALSEIIDRKGLQSEMSHTLKQVAIVRRQHPLATGDHALTAQDLAVTPLVRVNNAFSGSQAAESYLQSLGIEANWQYHTDHLESALAVVETSDVMLMAASTTLGWFNSVYRENFALLPLPGNTPERKMELYWADYWQRNPGHRWVREFICRELQASLRDELNWLSDD